MNKTLSFRRVLIVDDHAIVRRALGRSLSSYRHLFDEDGSPVQLMVGEAEDGRDALRRLLSGEAYDLIIADHKMPQLTGLELLAAVREAKALQHLPFVLISAAAVDLFDAARKFGASRVLPKPLRAAGMKATVLSTLRLRETNSRVMQLVWSQHETGIVEPQACD